jgi:uncharacterized protein
MNSDAVQTLKQIIAELHANPGADREALQARFAAAVNDSSAVELSMAEQEAIEDGIPRESIQQLCDVHLDMFVGEAREQRSTLAAGHPLSIMYDEHDILLGALRTARNTLMPADGNAPSPPDALGAVAKLLPVLEGADLNFIKQENAFFPIVEKHGITQPPAIMWSEHDMMRELFKAITGSGPGDLGRAGNLLLQAEEIMSSHVRKEETVIFQAALSMFSDDEWAGIRRDFDELGYLNEDVPEFEGAATPPEINRGAAAIDTAVPGGQIQLPSGSFSVDLLIGMLNTLPVDITLVDAQDKVLYFSESSERIFPRARSVVGRSVQNCHPPKSVHVVQDILDSFRAGTRDSEEFYLHLGEKYIYIRYYAMRNVEGDYLGCLEVSQDIAPIQAISGEKRII